MQKLSYLNCLQVERKIEGHHELLAIIIGMYGDYMNL